jgi:hypothetical protein
VRVVYAARLKSRSRRKLREWSSRAEFVVSIEEVRCEEYRRMCLGRWKVMERMKVEVEVEGATLESLLAAATPGTRVKPLGASEAMPRELVRT